MNNSERSSYYFPSIACWSSNTAIVRKVKIHSKEKNQNWLKVIKKQRMKKSKIISNKKRIKKEVRVFYNLNSIAC